MLNCTFILKIRGRENERFNGKRYHHMRAKYNDIDRFGDYRIHCYFLPGNPKMNNQYLDNQDDSFQYPVPPDVPLEPVEASIIFLIAVFIIWLIGHCIIYRTHISKWWNKKRGKKNDL